MNTAVYLPQNADVSLGTCNPTLSKKSFLGAAMGTMIEYYDYALISIFLPIISPIFFPAKSDYESLVKSYFMLMITMLARPLGGWLFGIWGDGIGRRKALLSSMYGIAVTTFLIGVIPGFAVMGMWAPVLLVALKGFQILCFGGEFNGAGIYVVEHVSKKYVGFAGGLLTATTLFGSLIASIIGMVLTLEGMPAWSWRIAFMLGGLLGVLGIMYRKQMIEPPTFKPADQVLHSSKSLFTACRVELLAGVFIGGFSTACFTTVLTFVDPVLMTKGLISKQEMMQLQTLFIAIAIVGLLFFGFIADKYTPRKIMRLASLALVALAYPLMLVVDSHKIVFMIPALGVLILINEMLLAPSHAYFKTLFAMPYRYRASSLSFCFGLSVLGGVTPVIENYLYQTTGHFSAAAAWLIFIGLGAFISLRFVQRKHEALAYQQRRDEY